ncbi:hypothetical protein [Halalkalibacter alkalisediminis]|uniref:Uncharacterized protein n=1 Tax=Halalkalibacter alkalisediminis TaxID=935616 RepID=A0ABV6NKN8_9BACI|nr:hypothetical protein [Halalkalibacter alkalisediminis]
MIYRKEGSICDTFSQPNERSFASKEVAEEADIAIPTVRKYDQILTRNGYELLKDGDWRIFFNLTSNRL